LLAGPRGLDHLVARAVAPAEEAVAEMNDGIIPHQGFLAGEQSMVKHRSTTPREKELNFPPDASPSAQTENIFLCGF